MNKEEMEKAIRLNNKRYEDKIVDLKLELKKEKQLTKNEIKLRKRTFTILHKTIKHLNKIIESNKRQILFLNELLDKREEELKQFAKSEVKE